MALRKGDLKQAIEQYTAIIGTPGVSSVDRARAELNRGLANQRQGLFAKAAEDYGAALADDVLDAKTRSIALYNRGLAHRRLNQPGRAVEDFTSALFLNANFAEAYMSRGLVLRESAKPYYALADFHKAIESKFERAHLAYFARAMVFEELGRPKDARSELSRALMVKPDFAEARQKMATLGGELPDTVASVIPASTAATAPGDATATAPEPVSAPRNQRVASLSGDAMVTGSLGNTANGPRLEKSAGTLPRAVLPPAHLLSDDARSPVKSASASPSIARSSVSNTAQLAPASGLASPELAKASPEPAAKPVKLASASPTVLSDAQPTSPVVDKTPAAKAVAAAVPAGWTIQLSSATSENGAWGTWKKLKAKHDLLKDREANVVRADLGSKGIYYRLRLAGFDSSKDANDTCGSLKKRGLSCFVAKAD